MPEAPPRDLTQTTLRIGFIVLLTAASLWVFSPFLPATIWATMIVIATWPAMLRLQGLLGGKRGRAVTAMAIILLLLFVVPCTIVSMAVVQNSGQAVDWLNSLRTQPLPQPPTWLEGIPLVGQKIASTWRDLISKGPDSLVAQVAPYLGTIFQWFVSKIGSLGILTIQFLLTVIICSILYTSGESAGNAVKRFGFRLAGDQGEQSVILAGKAIRGIALGVVVTALLQSGAAGLGLAVAGVPAAAVLTAVMFVLCIAQLGPTIVMLAAVAWVYWSGENLMGTVLLVWSLAVGAMDNVIKPMLIRKGVDLPFLLIMSGVMGGMIAFGIVGIFIGPIVLAVTYTLLQEWVRQGAESHP